MDYVIKPSNIDGMVFLGDIESATHSPTLSSLQIKRVITLDIRPLDKYQKDINYLFIKANDFQNEDLLSHFEECYQFINDGLLKGDKVLVHCVAGVSRSATIVISYIMIKNSMTFEEAFDLVKKKRDFIEPNPGFKRQLILFGQMNRRVDAMNTDYRIFLLNHLRSKIFFCRPWIRSQPNDSRSVSEPLTDYFKKLRNFMPKNKTQQKPEDIYKCKKCRLFLFNGINVLRNKCQESDLSTLCNSIFIEPLNFMIPYIKDQELGPINCPNCFSKIGNFNWNQFSCKCNSHNDLNCLIFKIDDKKVDSPYLKF